MKISPLLLTAALTLTGCVLSTPEIHSENWTDKGTPQTDFVSGQIPAIVVDNVAEGTPIDLKVFRLPDRTLVTTRSGSIPMRTASSHFIFREPFRELGAGNYTVELWIEGRLKATHDFTVAQK